MSKLRISIILIGMLLLLLAGVLKAEEDKKPRLITVEYDLSEYHEREMYTDQVVAGYSYIDAYEPDGYLPPRIVNDIRILCLPKEWDDDGDGAIDLRESRLLIINTIQVHKEVERFLATLLPKRRAYSMRLVVFKKQGYSAGGFGDLSKMGAGKAAKKLLEAGFEKAYDTVASIRTDTLTVLHDYEERTYIADYEGLIATFSKILDPVVKSMRIGYGFRTHLQETQTGVRLHLAQFAYNLEKMETIMVGKYIVEKPTITSSKWQRTFEFSGPSLKVASNFSHGFHQVMFVELLEE